MESTVPGVALAFVGLLGLAWNNVRTLRLPDKVTLPLAAAVLIVLSFGGLIAHDPAMISRAVVGGLAMAVLHLAVRLAWPAGYGFGNVKAAPTLGLAAGALGLTAWLLAAFVPMAIFGAIVLVGLLPNGAVRGRRVPSGPILLAGLMVATASTLW